MLTFLGQLNMHRQEACTNGVNRFFGECINLHQTISQFCWLGNLAYALRKPFLENTPPPLSRVYIIISFVQGPSHVCLLLMNIYS